MHILSLDGSGPFGYMQQFILNDIMNITTLILRKPKTFMKIISRYDDAKNIGINIFDIIGIVHI